MRLPLPARVGSLVTPEGRGCRVTVPRSVVSARLALWTLVVPCIWTLCSEDRRRVARAATVAASSSPPEREVVCCVRAWPVAAAACSGAGRALAWLGDGCDPPRTPDRGLVVFGWTVSVGGHGWHCACFQVVGNVGWVEVKIRSSVEKRGWGDDLCVLFCLRMLCLVFLR